MKNLKIAVAHLKYDTDKYPDSFEYVMSHLEGVEIEKEYIIVDNYNTNKPPQVCGSVHTIPGDNTNWEFSGWQKGFDYICQNIECDFVLFTTDALRQQPFKLLEQHNLKDLIIKSIDQDLFLGKVDRWREGDHFFLKYKKLHRWVCTAAFGGPPKLFNDVSIDPSHFFDIDSLIPSIDEFMDSKIIGKDLVKEIYLYLSKVWHSKFDPASDIDLFKNKTKAILNEKLLTARILDYGYEIYDADTGGVYRTATPLGKKYTWCFMGQAEGRPTRKAMLSELKKLSGKHFENHNMGWQTPDMIEQSEYKKILSDSIFVPCPKGNSSVDSFRFCETLEAGSIPIPEKGDGYWDKLLGPDHPFYIQANSDWKGITEQLESLLSNEKILAGYNKKVSDWWGNHKIKLRQTFSSIISHKPTKTLDLNSLDERRKEFSKLSIYNKTEPRDNMWEILIDDERLGKHRKPYDWLSYSCSLIPEQEIPEEKFSTFNVGNKIAVVSLHTPEISDFGIYSERSIQEYCEHQGYTFHIYRDKLDESFSPNWSKAQILLNHIDDHDYIIWMDSDTLVVDPSKTFEDIIKESNKDILACSDIGGNSKLNSGIVIFKSSDYSKNILNNWHNFEGDKSDLYASGGDQEILVETILNVDPDFNNVEIFGMDRFNTDPRFATEDSFILHFMAYPHVFKKLFMSYWHK